jgi:hypothetical protein
MYSKDGLKLEILLTYPPKYWDYRHVPVRQGPSSLDSPWTLNIITGNLCVLFFFKSLCSQIFFKCCWDVSHYTLNNSRMDELKKGIKD